MEIKIPDFKIFEIMGISFAKKQHNIMPEDFQLAIYHLQDANDGKWFEIRFEMDGETLEIRAGFAVFFTITNQDITDHLKAFIMKSAYPFIRSYINQVTSSSSRPGVLLPVINIDQGFHNDKIEMKVNRKK